MLILSRKKEERLTIEIPGMPSIEILVAGVSGNRAILGIDAPKEYKILRNEIINIPIS